VPEWSASPQPGPVEEAPTVVADPRRRLSHVGSRGPVAEADEYPVLLVRGEDQFAVDGWFVYRSPRLPAVNEVVTVEDTLGGPQYQARVTRLTPDERFPIHATELEAAD
jgi:hypothetical protein